MFTQLHTMYVSFGSPSAPRYFSAFLINVRGRGTRHSKSGLCDPSKCARNMKMSLRPVEWRCPSRHKVFERYGPEPYTDKSPVSGVYCRGCHCGDHCGSIDTSHVTCLVRTV